MSERINSPASIYIAPSKVLGAGRGVFASKKIESGTLIERCPVITLPSHKERVLLRKTGLVNYYFLYGDNGDRAAICLGWGSVYNHSFTPNARYEKKVEEGYMDFIAHTAIEKNEEILVNYNGAPDDLRPLRIPGIPESLGGLAKESLLGRIKRRLSALIR